MPRSPISAADQALLDDLGGQGLRCSRHQLERWRQHGLLPRAVVEHRGARGNVATHPAQTAQVAQTLAQWSARGRPWQVLGLVLIAEGLFEHLSLETIRACLLWRIDAAEAFERRRIDAVTDRLAQQRLANPDALDIAEAVAALTGSRTDRATLRILMPVVTQHYPHWPVRRRRALIRSGTVWTVAELLGEDLDDDLKAITQGWDTREDMLAAAGDRLGRPTLDDQRTAVSTITAEEFVLLCVHLALTGADDPLYFGGALARAVTQLRFVYSDGYDHPVPPETMDDLVEGLNELLAERTEIQLEAE